MGNNPTFEYDDTDNVLSTVNSKYYDLKQLNSLEIDLPSSFGALHVNIASLDNHIDDLRLILSLLNYNFDVIGISEHKIMKDTFPANNIDIPGYKEFKFEPTGTTTNLVVGCVYRHPNSNISVHDFTYDLHLHMILHQW